MITIRRFAAATVVAIATHGWLAALDAGAAACPAAGVAIDVCVKNPTSATQFVTISGESVVNQNTCHSSFVRATYSEIVEVNVFNGATKCFPVTNLMSGQWVHHIEKVPGPPAMKQDRRVPVLFAAAGEPKARVSWTYFPSAIYVNLGGDGAEDATKCPVNAVSSPATCKFRDAIAKANQISTVANPTLIRFYVSPGTMTNTDPLRLKGSSNGGNITIDGIESDGRPWIVGDANAPQDPFYCMVDLNNKTNFRFESDNNTVQGLLIRNTVSSGQQTKDLITADTGRKNNLVYAVRIEGGNAMSCPANNCTGSSDLFSALGGTSFTQPAMTISNVEGHSAIDKGVKANNGWAVVKDSWFHHNYRGNVQATLAGKISAERNHVEKGGRRLSDDLIVDDGAQGLVANGSTSRLDTDANVSLLNRNNGIAVRESGSPMLAAKNDYTCGNRFSGVGVAGVGSITTGQGIGAFYNGANGVQITTTTSDPSANFGDSTGSANPGNNAFAHNDSGNCQFRYTNTSKAVNAHRNQWVNNAPSTCGGGTVNAGTVRNYFSDPMSLDFARPVIPSNAIIGGQTIRLRGSGFDGIRGNPPPSGGCTRGEASPSQSCCLTQPPAANVCGSGLHNPLADKGNCVELCDSVGTWTKLTVDAVTPTTIVTTIPGSVFMCTGETGAVHVSKRTPGGLFIKSEARYCTNAAPKDQI